MTVYSAASAYIISSATATSLWMSGEGLTLSDVPVQISVAEVDDRRYVLLSYDKRSEIWSIADRNLLGKFPELDSATFIPSLTGWVVTPAQPASESQFLKVVDGRIVTESMTVRISRTELRADAQDRYFIVDTEERGKELRHRHDRSPLPLPAPVKRFTFSRDPSVPIFAVHYQGSKPPEIRRIADGNLIYAIDYEGNVDIEFEAGEFFIINYLEADDRHKLFRSELRSNKDAALVTTDRDEIIGYASSSSDELLILETEDEYVDERDRDKRNLTVFLKSEDGYQRLKRSLIDLFGRVVFHPDPANLAFIGRDPKNRIANLYAIASDSTDPATRSVRRIGSSEAPAKIIEFFSSAQADYLLMGTKGDRLELWNMGKRPRRIFRSQVGLTGFVQLPGEGRFLLWYDDGRSYVLDARLIDLATAAIESGDPEDIVLFLSYIQEELFTGNWLNPEIINEQQALMRLD